MAKIYSVAYAGTLGVMGGVTKVLFNLATGRRTYTFRAFMINISLAFGAGWIAGEFLPMGLEYRDGFIGLAGVMAYETMYMVEYFVPKIILKKVSKWVGLDPKQSVEDYKDSK